jgi:Na+-transporting NADH:ubiquinone oxidoreductase subunit D
MPNVRPKEAFMTSLWNDNPIFRQILGICSTLAVTNLLINTLVMVAGLIYTAVLSNVTMSIMRNWIPRRIRIMVEVLIISAYVIILDLVLKAYLPDISRQLGAYVGLIITNCILMGRLEAFASQNPPLPSLFDGLGCGIGYGFILVGIAVVRELMGSRSLLGYTLLPEAIWTPWSIMVVPSGAFFALGVAVWVCRHLWEKGRNAEEAT